MSPVYFDQVFCIQLDPNRYCSYPHCTVDEDFLGQGCFSPCGDSLSIHSVCLLQTLNTKYCEARIWYNLFRCVFSRPKMKAQSSEGSSMDGIPVINAIRARSPKMGPRILLALIRVLQQQWIEALRYTWWQLLNYFQVTSPNKVITTFSRLAVEFCAK